MPPDLLKMQDGLDGLIIIIPLLSIAAKPIETKSKTLEEIEVERKNYAVEHARRKRTST
ncbi:MAG: hypothetical protein ACFFFC_06670 [Candidatus Thorarchaeota archaeon]